MRVRLRDFFYSSNNSRRWRDTNVSCALLFWYCAHWHLSVGVGFAGKAVMDSSAGFCAKGGATKAITADVASKPVAPNPEPELETPKTEPKAPVAQVASFSVLTKGNPESGCCRDASGGSGIEMVEILPASIDKCKQYCTAEPKCNGFEYHEWSNSCEVRRPCLSDNMNSLDFKDNHPFL